MKLLAFLSYEMNPNQNLKNLFYMYPFRNLDHYSGPTLTSRAIVCKILNVQYEWLFNFANKFHRV